MSESASIARADSPVNDSEEGKGQTRKFTLLMDQELWDGVQAALEALKNQTQVEVSIQAYLRSAIELRNAGVIGKAA